MSELLHPALEAGPAASGHNRGTLYRAQAWLGVGVDIVVSLLMAAEIVILGAGLVSRYVFHRPLIWTDELAGSVLLWLAMLGSVSALRRSEHLRLTTFVAAASDRVQVRLAAATVPLVLAFALFLIYFGCEYALEESFLISAGLGVSNAWRASGLATGGLLLAILGMSQVPTALNVAPKTTIAVGLAALSVLALALWGFSLSSLGNWSLLLFFLALLPAFMAIGLPIAIAFALSTIAYLAFTTDMPMTIIVGRLDGGMSHVMLLAVPLFIFLGKMMEMTGMAYALVNFIAQLVGHIRGGLSYALIGAIYVVSGISGAKTADMAAVAPILFPEMKRRGVADGDLVSLLAASAVMSETIPPSLVLIAIATSVGLSVADLFAAGLLPAILAAIALIGLVFYKSRRDPLPPKRVTSGTMVLKIFLAALPALLLPFLIRAAVVEGVATATEVAVVGIAYTVVVGLLVYRRFEFRRLYPMLLDTAVMSATLLLILGAANAMAWALTQSGFSDDLARIMSTVPAGRYGFLLVSILIFIVFGSVLEGLPAIALFAPLLFPIAKQMGINEIHYAMVTILAMGLGLYMPPFGVGYYSACAISKIDPDAGARHVWTYMGLLFCAVIVIAFVPWFSTAFL